MKVAIRFFGTFLFFIGALHAAHAQQGFGTANPNPNSVIDLTATDKGLLLPRLALQATNQAAPLGAHVAGMLVYNTATNGTGTPTAVRPGYYSNDGTQWIRIDINTTNVTLAVDGDDLVLTDSEGNTVQVPLADISISEASNGLHIENDEDYEATEGHVKLGGPLTKPTEIETDATNTLAITGLEPGNPDDDRIVTVNEDGVLKTVSSNKFVRFFYMPSIAFDTSTPNPTGPRYTKNLYDEYIKQFRNPVTPTPNPIPVRSDGAPREIPYLPNATDLYYYVTYYDTDVFDDLEISADGELRYRVIGPGTPTSFMNIVFVIKGEENQD
ncbi:hypothetical protein JHJ32_19595 [Parapedobacter sp. ISTM3]|uniref:hypothetical protein n=1 Tax=Parapedobacter sp. ISTM3 TaxID=2800130 RepID=UPI001907D5E8|nr:hypothetical protein [Parapedobacter sp. ISTM3]MBK1442210.1 hypothetical protein [Parapedobacter sp. ISTM3]